MTSFIFHCVPQQYNLSALAKSGKIPTSTQLWKATRYRHEMKPTDGVFFYMSGNQAGIYGCGQIVALPNNKARNVQVNWIALYPKPISRAALQPILKDNLLFTVKVGTNFLLSPQERADLDNLAKKRGLTLPP